MALTGQLSDLSLAELIECFCNQRKTGCLKVDYERGRGVFYVEEGELVDARLGNLRGVEAFHFALTEPNASFIFTAHERTAERTITVSWAQVILEGLCRFDEKHFARDDELFADDESSGVESDPKPNLSEKNTEGKPSFESNEIFALW